MIKFIDEKVLTFEELCTFFNASCTSVNPMYDENNFIYIASTSVELALKNSLLFVGGVIPNTHNYGTLTKYLELILDYLGLDDCISLLVAIEDSPPLEYCLYLDPSAVRYTFHLYQGNVYLSEDNFSKILTVLYSVRTSLESLVKSAGYTYNKSTARFPLVTNKLAPLTPDQLRKREPELRRRGLNFKRMLRVSIAYHSGTYKFRR